MKNYPLKLNNGFEGIDDYFANLFEDIFLLTLVHRFYEHAEEDDFEQAFKNMLPDYSLLPAFLRNMYEDHVDLVTALSERISAHSNSNLQDIIVAGDVHPQIAKIHSVHKGGEQRISFFSPFSHRDILRDVSSEAMPEITNMFPKTHSSDNYYWREFREINQSGTQKDIKEFYYNLGQATALMLALRGYDMNAENMLCDMPLPYFFDTECLFAPGIRDDKYSLLATGISDPNYKENASVLFAGDKKRTSYLKPVLSGTKSKPIIKWIVPSNKKLSNRPLHNGKQVFASDYSEELIAGYDSGVAKILKNINKIIEIVNESNFYNRILLRPTRLYVAAIRKITFPDIYQDNNFSADKYFQSEITSTPIITNAELISDHAAHESSQLQKAIVPAYYCHINSTKILSSENFEIGVLPETPFATWLSHTKSLDEFLNTQKINLLDGLNKHKNNL